MATDESMDTDESLSPQGEKTPVRLILDETLARQMSDALILEEDICEVIRHCESTGRKLIDPQTGGITGYLRRGIVTYWAEYTAGEETGCFNLIRAYSHRLTIEED